MENSKNALKTMGYEILAEAKKTANGPDLHVKRGSVILRVEVKKARKVRNSMAVHPVEKERRSDDLVSIEFPSGYVLVEPMQDHLKSCAPSGSRSFWGVY